MNIKEEISQLCSYNQEREWFEFKVNWCDPIKIGEYVSALSNSAALADKSHGLLIWGIQDKTHKIVGTKFDFDCDVKNEPLKHFLARQLKPDINFKFQDLRFSNKRVVVLVIPAAKEVPTEFAKERYVRIGSSTVSLRKYPKLETDLFAKLRHDTPTITNTSSNYQNLTFKQLFMYYAAKGIALNRNTFVNNLGLKTEDGKYNILAQLLSDNSHVSINVAIFTGANKSDKMYSLKQFGYQCLLYSLDDILRYADIVNIVQTDESQRVVERKDTNLFDKDACREAIINAFLHNYWLDEDEPMFTIYSNRIEILSRGTIPPKQTKEGFFAGESVPVNRKLSEIFLQLHISEKTGRGVPIIINKYGRKAYTFRDSSILVTIPYNRLSVIHNKTKKELRRNTLNRTQTNILAEIRNNPNITKVQISHNLGLGKTIIDKGIAVLKEKRIIKRVGSNKNGYWQVRE